MRKERSLDPILKTAKNPYGPIVDSIPRFSLTRGIDPVDPLMRRQMVARLGIRPRQYDERARRIDGRERPQPKGRVWAHACPAGAQLLRFRQCVFVSAENMHIRMIGE